MPMTISGLLSIGLVAVAVAAGGTSCGSNSASGGGGSGGIAPVTSGSAGGAAGSTGGAPMPAASGGSSGAATAGGAGGAASGTGGAPGKACTSDDMCRAMADYCTGCDCRAYGPGEQVAPCSGPGVRCLADPCRNKKAACQKGRCTVVDALPSVRPPKTTYDPCAGKKCGDMCHMCPPDAADCMETAQVKQCSAAGKCGGEDPGCPGR
jgi:hypothetical protein